MHSGDLSGKEVQKGGDTCISTAASLCCTVETNTKLKSNYGAGLVAKSCPTFATPGTVGLQAPLLEWLAISFSRRSSRPRD